jgi:hypothetical protein
MAARACDGAARASQRVSAALGMGVAADLTMKTRTPDALAARASRRLAVRS